MPKWKTYLKYGIGTVLGLFVFVFLLNQIDAPLNPRLKDLFAKPDVVSESEKFFYESFVAQNYCQGRELSEKQIEEVLVAMEEAAPFSSFYLEDFQKRMGCLTQLFTANNFALFGDLTLRHKKNQPETEMRIRKALSLGLKLAKNPTALDYLRSTMLIQYALAEAEKVALRNPHYRLPYRSELSEFIQTPLQQRLETIRDYEVLIAERTFLPRFLEGPGNAQVQGASWIGRFLGPYFLQRNRTLNNLDRYWNQGIEHSVACTGRAQPCPPLPWPKMHFYNFIFNPVGQSLVVLLAPQMENLTTRLLERTALIQQSFQRLKK